MPKYTSDKNKHIRYSENTNKYFETIFEQIKSQNLLDLLDTELRSPLERKEFGNVLGNIIFDRNGHRIMNKQYKSNEFFVANKLFMPFSEIMQSYESLKNILLYIRAFPCKQKDISRLRYIRYHIENYLNELYLLKERLTSYVNLLDKAYKKSPLYQKEHFESLSQMVLELFRNSANIRGKHVHLRRYRYPDIDRLFLLDLLYNNGIGEFKNNIGLLYAQVYKDVRKKWAKRIKSDLENIDQFIDLYFSKLYATITENGSLLLPP